MKKYFLLMLFLYGCSSSPRANLLQKIRNHPDTKINEIPTTPDKARSIINNKRQFLKLLFEQSVDPYYGTPKWTEKCLKENKIGTIEEYDGNLQFLSSLYVNQEFEFGHCPSHAKAQIMNVLYLYCSNSSSILEFKFSSSNFQYSTGDKICP